jgi:hypothetical protein
MLRHVFKVPWQGSSRGDDRQFGPSAPQAALQTEIVSISEGRCSADHWRRVSATFSHACTFLQAAFHMFGINRGGAGTRESYVQDLVPLLARVGRKPWELVERSIVREREQRMRFERLQSKAQASLAEADRRLTSACAAYSEA